MCKPCVNWKFETAETWALRFDSAESLSKSVIKMNQTNYTFKFLF